MKILLACLSFIIVLPLSAQTITTVEEQPKPIPFDQFGVEAQKQYAGDGIGITPTAGGARLRAIMQRIEGEATAEGLWLSSTAEEDAGLVNRFRVRAVEMGRMGRMSQIAPTGVVQATKDAAVWLRPDLAEEYTVSSEGVRQDFVVAARPAGTGELAVELEVAGASAQEAAHGATLTLDAMGRTLAYHRLRVSDATGRELAARLEVPTTDRLRVVVEDAGAVYPVRIDPTFSDADWVSLNPGLPGANLTVRAMAVDGSGNLFIGGDFTVTGTVVASRIAKWNGSAWSALGTGMNGFVNALVVSGSDLYAGGSFTTAGGVAAIRIAKWNGSAWSALGTGMDDTVRALAVSGSDLYAGGSFTTAGGTSAIGIAKWNGSAWSALGLGISGTVYALAVSGSDLYAGGAFTTAGGTSANYIAKWNGSAWSALGSGMDSQVNALAVSGSDLYAGGAFTTAGGTSAGYIAKWNGSAWSALGTGMSSSVNALAVSGSDLYAGGAFTTAGGTSANYIAKWNGSAWSALGTGMNSSVHTLTVSGSDLYAGGNFVEAGSAPANHIAKWNGSVWSALGTGMDSDVNALAVIGSDLYAGGNFTTAGGTPANYIAKWNGSAWSPVSTGMDGSVQFLLASGSDLYAGGDFTTAGGVGANRVAKWNGSAWSALGTGVNGIVRALVLSGSDLYVGGNLSMAGGASANRIAKWDGSTWSALGTGMNAIVFALAVDNAGHLFVGGSYTLAGTTVSPFIAMGNLISAAPDVPTVTNVAPASGTTSGGTSVTITGTNFTGATGVTFGGTAATSVNVVDATTITAVTPAHAAGAVSVLVTTPGGTNAANSLYTYVAPPTITSATYDVPTRTLVVTGTDFPGLGGAGNDIDVSKLRIRGEGGAQYTLSATSDVEITSATSFTVVLVAADSDPLGQLTNKNGSISTSGTSYNLVALEDWAAGAAPSDVVADASSPVTVTSVPLPTLTSATYHAVSGVLDVTGTGFLSKAGVSKDINATKLRIIGELGLGYTLTDTPNVYTSSPTAFALTLSATDKAAVAPLLNRNGGTSLDISSFLLAGLDDWAAGADPALNIADLNGNPITVLGVVADVTAPVFASAAVNGSTLVMSYPDANFLSSANPPTTGLFSVISGGSANPVTGVTVQAQARTVTLTLTLAVTFGQAVTVAYTDPTAGDDASAIQDAALNDAATLAATSVTNNTPAPPPPTLTLVTPANGTTAGGTNVTITGANFAGATAVTFGGTNATSFTVDSPTQINATTPAHAAGAVSVLVTTPGGTNAANTAFTYLASSNADLAALILSHGALTPGFSSGTTTYTASVPHAVDTVTVRPFAADAGATLSVNGTPLVSGTVSSGLPLSVGPNVITTLVTAEDNATTRSYEITVTRAPAPVGGGQGPAFEEFIDPNPSPGNLFGHSVVALSTGNVVITSPYDDAGGTDAGAAYLFNGATGALISTVTGSMANDNVGLDGVVALATGNYLIRTTYWHDVGVGLDPGLGAVTFGNGVTGVSGVVSAANSLVGTQTGDNVGHGGVIALSNGNYVVCSDFWDDGTIVSAGAATFGNGTTGIVGPVTTANSLHGTGQIDAVGEGGAIALSNGNYVVVSYYWGGGPTLGVGAVTLVDGLTGMSGPVTAANSLVGSTPGDWVGLRANDSTAQGVTALSNGNFVVNSGAWHHEGTVNAGAVTFVDGTTGLTGPVTTANSLHGTSTDDSVGRTVIALSNGSYVVNSFNWDHGGTVNVGAVTFGNGSTGVTGPISTANSLHGSTAFDLVGGRGVVALSNGNYVVASREWDHGAIVNAGAATWGSGTVGIVGPVTSANSLHGSILNDLVGNAVVALANGNYVVQHESWNNGVPNARIGAVTWADGSTGLTGPVTTANSLYGSTATDFSFCGTTALTNGNYVIRIQSWDNAGIVNAGAVVFGNGSTGIVGPVTTANSLHGTVASGMNGVIVPLTQGNYVVSSIFTDIGSIVDAGTVTFGNGTTGITGAATAANSLHGRSNFDLLGLGVSSAVIKALSNGNYVIPSRRYSDSGLSAVGAFTFGNGTTGSFGPATASNSLFGKQANTGDGLREVVEDRVNGTFYARFLFEDNGKVRVGSTETGFAPPATPEITITGSGLEITSGDPSPSSADHTNFGSAALTGGTVARLFTVTNTGTAPLNLTGSPVVQISGAHASDFTAVATPGTPIAPLDFSTFEIEFDPSDSGTRTALVTVESDDPLLPTYTFAIQGTGGVGSEIVVHNGSHSLAPELTDGQVTTVNFGSTAPNVASVRNFTVRNTGVADLTISSITVPSGYVTSGAAATLAPGSSYGFQVSLSSATPATFAGSVVINSDDSDEAAFDFPVTGTVVALDSDPVVNVGENIAVQGTTGSAALGGPPGSTLYQFIGSPAINSSGVVASAVQIRHADASLHTGMMVGQPLVLIAAATQTAPSLPGVTHYNFGPPVINETNHIAFIGEVRGAGITANVNSRCLFSNASDGSLKLVARTGTSIGLTSNLKTIGNFSIGGDLIIFLGTLVDNSVVLFGWDASTGLRPLMRKGQSLDANGITKTVKSFSILETGNASSGHGKEISVSPTGEMLVTFAVVFTDNTQAVVVGSFDGTSDTGYGLSYAASNQLADSYAVPPVIPLAKWSSFRSPGFDNTGTYYGFISQMVTNTLAGVSSTNNVGVFVDTAPGVLTLQLRENDVATGTGGLVFSDFSDLVLGGGDYEFLVKGEVRGSGVTVNVNDKGLWAQHATNGLVLVAREGSEAPGVAGSTFFRLTQIALPGIAQPMFQASMKTGTGGVTTANDTGLWVVNESGAVKLAVREGDVINVGGTPRTVTAITALLNGTTTGGALGRRVFLADGQLTLLLTFSGGVQANAKVVVP